MASTTDHAPRTRSVLLVVLAVCTGVYFDIAFGPADPAAFPTMGLIGFAAGTVAALLLGTLVALIAERRHHNRRPVRGGDW